ncbi:MAG: HAMP domain-containing histidine kinase [Bdellovibrionaceae bacterium]|nr:HAMP domain-containing histidine kinase [Pseudobdellovibrionaceae bacterium]
MTKTAKTLNHFIIKSWLITGLIAVLTSLSLFLSVGYFGYLKSADKANETLKINATTIARRISAELLIKKNDVAESIALKFAKDYNLKSVEIVPAEANIQKSNSKTDVTIPVPYLENQYSVTIKANEVNFFEHFNLKILLTSLFSISLLTLLGSWIQMKYIYRNIINPIKELVATSTGEKAAKITWPKEVQDISNQLTQSFKDREQVIYSQIARGVIHDIKTLLQSMQVASDLAIEKETEARYKNLANVNRTNLPKLLEIINTALDGSREIQIYNNSTDINQTLQNSIESIKFLSEQSLVKIEIESSLNTQNVVPHDSIQMERVFTNLIKNAIESTSTSNSTSKHIIISINLLNNMIQISIEDSGTGLRDYNQNQIRMLKSTKLHGSGLGLTISRKITESHYGLLSFEKSQLLGGAKITVSLPSLLTNHNENLNSVVTL